MNFLFIVGAPKAGTTTLANLLDSSDNLSLGKIKEPCFFTNYENISWAGPAKLTNIISTESEYLENFSNNDKAEWFIDASTDYLSCTESIEKLKAWSKRYQCKFICILRDPVERAISQYQHTLRDQIENVSFSEAIDLEQLRIRENWHPLFYHVRRSQYYDDCLQYMNTFGEDFLLLDFDELKNSRDLLKKVENFLGSNHSGNIPSQQHDNASYIHRSTLIRKVLYSDTLKKLLRPFFPKHLRKKLWHKLSAFNKKKYTPGAHEIEKLKDILEKDIKLCKNDSRFPTGSWK